LAIPVNKALRTATKPAAALSAPFIPDLWRHTLAQIPTVFGRLVYLSLLRDPNSGTYRHHRLAMFFGDEETNRTLRTSHVRMFAEWLGFYLEQQKSRPGDAAGLLRNACNVAAPDPDA